MDAGDAALQESTITWVRITGGRFPMGSSDFYPEERPEHEQAVESFEITQTPITNAQYAAFVEATGYVTLAERGLDWKSFPHLGPDELAPGSLVFIPPTSPVDLRDWHLWWTWLPGTHWRAPLGPGSSTRGKETHPVVHIAHQDASAYATWIGARLPTEAEQEFAAGGGLKPMPYSWGRERDPAGVAMANTWHGRFPYLNFGSRGWVGTSPVDAFPPNGFGIFDCIGNVWEWTSDFFTESHAQGTGQEPYKSPLLGESGRPINGPSGWERESLEIPCRVIKGGSHLSAPEYSLSYRPAARTAQAEDSARSDLGFRCARSAAPVQRVRV
ncbi:sulfatase-modifying factor 1 [Arthrobacter psychrolactophilus]|uniref:Sulfatase-modifying factor 1 n=2 Tax=Arthrobacter psychrolactophilus TaxID=92442 RepID=A0A2V5IN91_9MICC|nr:sulfatase-modifying factor 1 [Arthrobacter psychrolactophilus]